MMNPPIEDLLDTVDSKFSLVTLAARRARQINSYFNQLGDGLGHMVPPQVSSIARKPLSIGFEEIAAHKIVRVELPDPETETRCRRARATTPSPDPRQRHDFHARRQAHRSRCHRGHRRLQGRRGLPTTGRCRRPRHPGDDARAPSTSSASPRCRRWPASRCRPACGTRTRPIPHTRLGQSADLVLVAPATARLIGAYAAGLSTDLLDQRPAGHPCPGDRLPGDAHRDVGAPGGRRQHRHAAPPRRAHRRARRGPSGRRRLGQGSAGLARADRRRGRAGPRRRRARRSARRRDRRRHSRADRRRAGHRQSQQRQAGLCGRRRGAGAGRTRDAGLDGRPAHAARRRRCEPVETAARDAGRGRGAGTGRRRRGHGRGRRRLPPEGRRDRQDQEGRRRSRDRARADARHPRRRSARASGPVRSWSASPPRPAIWWPTPRPSCAARTSISSSPTTSVRPQVGFQHDTNAVTILCAGTAHQDRRAHGQAFGRQGDTAMCRRTAIWCK